MSKSGKSGCRAGSSTRTVYTGGPARQRQTPIYGKPQLAETRTNISGIKVSRKPHTIGAPKEK